MRVKVGESLYLLFDGSTANNCLENRPVDMQEPVFGMIENLEPQGVDYCGFLKDMNQIKPELNLQEIIERERATGFRGSKKIYKVGKRA